jgi:hypothetical protein
MRRSRLASPPNEPLLIWITIAPQELLNKIPDLIPMSRMLSNMSVLELTTFSTVHWLLQKQTGKAYIACLPRTSIAAHLRFSQWASQPTLIPRYHFSIGA